MRSSKIERKAYEQAARVLGCERLCSGAVKRRHVERLFVPTNASPRVPQARVSQLLNLVAWSIANDSMTAALAEDLP